VSHVPLSEQNNRSVQRAATVKLTPPLLQQLVIITLATSISGHRHEAHLVRARRMAPYKSVLIDRSIYRQSKAWCPYYVCPTATAAAASAAVDRYSAASVRFGPTVR